MMSKNYKLCTIVYITTLVYKFSRFKVKYMYSNRIIIDYESNYI